MAEPYIGEIRIFAGNFAPVGWALCQGQIQSIADNSALFALIGTTYGGDGQQTFALPNLQSRVPIHQGTHAGFSYVIGQSGGTETVTLTNATTPQHTHIALSSTTQNSTSPANAYWANSSFGDTPYSTQAPNTTMNNTSISATGGNQLHDNIQPYLTLNFIIALEGIFPSQS